jgi:TRAP-type C4-dicarboxylate transport system substrate-binding protein
MERYLLAKGSGRSSIQVFAGAQLGEESEIIEQTRAGAIDIARVNLASLADLAPICSLFCLPGLIDSDDHLQRVISGPLVEEITSALAEIGLVLLTFYDSGARSIYNRLKPVRVLSDLQGMTIRVQTSEIMNRSMTALGAKPVHLGFTQLLPALQAGLVDGAENNWPSYVTTDQFRAAPFLTITEHSRPPEVLVLAKSRWRTMSSQEQQELLAAAAESRSFTRLRWIEWMEMSQRQAAVGGVSVIESFDRGELLKALAPLQDTVLSDATLARFAEKILAVRP